MGQGRHIYGKKKSKQLSPGGFRSTICIPGIFALTEYCHMNETYEKLKDLFHRIPRRHTADNVKEIYSILDAYEEVLLEMERDSRYAQQVVPLFAALDPIRATVKKSNDPRASKKTKDQLFDEASGALKDTVEEAMKL